MRYLLPLVLAPALFGQAPEPGAPEGFGTKVLASIATDPLDLWRKEIRRPTLSVVVEVVAEISREEKQLIAFNDMRARLFAELHDLLKDTAPMGGRGSGPAMLTLMRAEF